jgi:hypothetical protein
MSLAPYWWPNPATKDHLPYIRKDGEHNPEKKTIPDDVQLGQMEKTVNSLTLGYAVTHDEKYAERAGVLLRAWFLDPATLMNPNLNYGQAIKGVTEGRGIGMIETHGLVDVTHDIWRLAASSSMDSADNDGFKDWFRRFLLWSQTSKNGKEESIQTNNHGSWYDYQVVGYALYSGNKALAKQLVEEAKTKRLDVQLEADGRQPLELIRTNAFSYSCYNLTALMKLAEEGDSVGVDLWSYKSSKGGTIRGALDYLLPFAIGEKKWTYPEIQGLKGQGLVTPLLLGAIHYKDAKYLAAAQKLGIDSSGEIQTLRVRAEAAVAGK